MEVASDNRNLNRAVEMCNVFHTLHGACAVYIMDP